MTNEALIILTASLPVSELRGAIPLGLLSFNEPVLKVVFLSILGNILPVPFLLMLLMPISEKLRQFPLWKKFFDWLFERTRKRAKLVERYEALGLILFVAIPLPMTGAWTGAMAASLFKIRFRYAFVCIIIGICIAAAVVTMLTLGSINIFSKP